MQAVNDAQRAVVTVGVKLATPRWEIAYHTHEKSQLHLSLSGAGTCETDEPLSAAEAYITALLLHEVETARVDDLHLPMPTEPRLRTGVRECRKFCNHVPQGVGSVACTLHGSAFGGRLVR